ncbi:MAG TPA: carbohydrate kinase family protein [Jatrophihabitans sp.]|nr:carbohydrate kinase family protein [Jatrophihabitans sp.]
MPPGGGRVRPVGRLGPDGRVVCVGDVLLDICALLPGPLVHGSDTPAPVSYLHGGSAANTAAWLASLGVPCLFAGRVGEDAFGREAVAALRAQGVRTRVATDPVAPTGACLVLIDPDGERTMVPSAGANANLSPADLGPDLLRAGDHLHLSGYALLNDGSRDAARYALELAGAAGASVSVDAASARTTRTPARSTRTPASRRWWLAAWTWWSSAAAGAACSAPRPGAGAHPPPRSRCWTPPAPGTPSPPGCWPRCATAPGWSKRWQTATGWAAWWSAASAPVRGRGPSGRPAGSAQPFRPPLVASTPGYRPRLRSRLIV